jgi:hypothetical protein
MANTINAGLNDKILVQEGLEAFKAGLAPIRAFSLDLRDEARRKGETVVVPLITGMTAGDFADDYETGNSSLSAKTVTLSVSSFRSFHLTDTEASKTSVEVQMLQAREAAHSVAKKVVLEAWSKITASAYGAAAFTGAASGFDADDVTDVAGACDDADMPEENRVLILSRAYHTALLKDSSLKDASASGSNAPLREGATGRLAGFEVFKSTIVPGNIPRPWRWQSAPSGPRQPRTSSRTPRCRTKPAGSYSVSAGGTPRRPA